MIRLALNTVFKLHPVTYTNFAEVRLCNVVQRRKISVSNRYLQNVNESTTESIGNDEESSIKNEKEKDQKDDRDYENDIKNRILESSLQFVPTHGWTKKAIVAGAEAIGYPGVVKEMFPLGSSSLTLYFYSSCNAKLTQHLKEQLNTVVLDSDKGPSIKLFVSNAVETRLRMIIPYIDSWPQAMATLTLPKAVPSALSNLLTLSDDICYYAGDRSVSFDWYARRIALAGIYKVTELYMIQDRSEDYKNTWQFLRRQLDEGEKIYSCIQQSEQASQFTKEVASATFTTARNILGLNWKR